ncbi:MAG TPA: ribosome small subunit-dependent GTPase A, partial [Acholeplasmataceae bacterium]|nr:ribosome small subunit-dependent GTPase A [Acholeplasmataceae bacterium]
MISNQYTLIDLETKEEVVAAARGKLRFMKLDEKSSFNKIVTMKSKKDIKTIQISPKVGDYVYYDDAEDIPMIMEIMPRENDLERPDVANVDQVLLVFSAIKPDFSFNLLDKFLIIMSQERLKPVIVISKIDLVDDKTLNILKDQLQYYVNMGHELYYVNSKQRIGIDTLTHVFQDKITVLAGQTGVGKSTLLNALMPELGLKTQEISEALGRGKHTTRHTEL